MLNNEHFCRRIISEIFCKGKRKVEVFMFAKVCIGVKTNLKVKALNKDEKKIRKELRSK